MTCWTPATWGRPPIPENNCATSSSAYPACDLLDSNVPNCSGVFPVPCAGLVVFRDISELVACTSPTGNGIIGHKTAIQQPLAPFFSIRLSLVIFYPPTGAQSISCRNRSPYCLRRSPIPSPKEPPCSPCGSR